MAVYNGFGGDVSGVRDALGVQADEEVHIDGRVQDLIAYRRALDAVACDRVAFVNGWAEPIADGWLATLSAALDADGVGIAGCTASWESPASAAPPHLKLHRRGLFEPFPNPHVRTNGVGDRGRPRPLARRGTSGAARWGPSRWRAASRASRGRCRPTGCGRSWCPGTASSRSRTGRRRACSAPGRQEELLVRDNRTRQYDDADPRRKAFLARMAWGIGP